VLFFYTLKVKSESKVLQFYWHVRVGGNPACLNVSLRIEHFSRMV